MKKRVWETYSGGDLEFVVVSHVTLLAWTVQNVIGSQVPLKFKVLLSQTGDVPSGALALTWGAE